MELSPFQIQIALLMVKGLSAKDMSKALNKSAVAIGNQKTLMFRKNDCKNSAQFIYKAVKAGLLVLIISLCSIASMAQCVEVDRFFTTGLHYITGNKASGFQLEIGSTGSESNISYYATITGFKAKKAYDNSSEPNYPEMAYGVKLAYRFVRVENVLNLYVTTLVADDIVKGFYNASSIKLLTVFGGKVAFSVEPSYLPRQKTFMAQAGINVILD